jgi:hypothetical protein
MRREEMVKLKGHLALSFKRIGPKPIFVLEGGGCSLCGMCGL